MINIPGYRIEGELGKGGQARVYLATQESFQRKVAIKVLLEEYANDGEFADRFLREARTVAHLSHPNIVPVYDFGQAGGTYFMVMEFLPGGDLNERISHGLNEHQVLTITAQLAEALHFAHKKGYVHRDVKPGNIMFREDGSSVLTDFGIARLQSGANQMTMVGQVLGTPKFMSPEQLQDRQLDGRSDLYSLGILFHLMLTRRVPYDHQDFMTVAMMHCKEPVPKLPRAFEQYQSIFERMVAKDADMRFASGEELAGLLRDIVNGNVDAAGVDSASAASLKKTAAFRAQNIQDPETVPKQYLPWDTAVALQDMDPVLNTNWYRKTLRILKGLDRDKRKYVLAHHLQPKGIYVDQTTRKLVFTGRPGVSDISKELNSTRLREVATRLEKAEDAMRTTREATALADLMEGSLGIIDKFDAGDDLAAQKEKMALRQAFLDDLAYIVRGAKLAIPENRRTLTEDAIKTFFVEVFLKQQMLGYRFKPFPISRLEKHRNGFLREVVAREARTRQCDLVKTERYIFLIAPATDARQNAYSARRFLHEEAILEGKVVYFNGVAIALASLDQESARSHIAWSISRIVTLERRLSAGLSELVNEIEDVRTNYLTPLLRRDIALDGTRIEDSIAGLLADCERQLCKRAMVRLPEATSKLARTEDDYEYLFHSWRNLLIQVGCDIRDFTSQFAATFSPTAEELDKKIMAYLALLDKRKDTVFTPGGAAEDDPFLDANNPAREFLEVLDKYEPEVKRLNRMLREATHQDSENRGPLQSLLDKLTGREKKQWTPAMVENEILETRKRALIDLIRVCKRYPNVTVFLELEELSEVSDNMRHYALPSGELGLAELPRLISLYEDPAEFDFDEVRKRLSFSVLKQEQGRAATNAA